MSKNTKFRFVELSIGPNGRIIVNTDLSSSELEELLKRLREFGVSIEVKGGATCG